MGLDGKLIAGQTDWERVRAMTEEEIMAAALVDPDAQPLSEHGLKRARRLGELPGNTLIEKCTPYYKNTNIFK